MAIAGLDIASKTGLAAIDGDRIVTATWQAPKRKDQVFETERDTTIDPAHSGQIGRAFEDFLRAWLIEQSVTHVAVEMPLRSNTQKMVMTVDTSAAFAGQAIRREYKNVTNMATMYRLYGLNFVACSVCARLNIPVEIVNQTEWRKAFLGSGSPKDAKAAAVEQCKRLRIPYSSVDACEAVGIAWWLRGVLNPHQFRRANDLFALPPTNQQSISPGGA